MQLFRLGIEALRAFDDLAELHEVSNHLRAHGSEAPGALCLEGTFQATQLEIYRQPVMQRAFDRLWVTGVRVYGCHDF